MYSIEVSYDGNAPKVYNYSTFDQAVNEYGLYKDWGFADEYSTVTLKAGDHVASKTFRRPN